MIHIIGSPSSNAKAVYYAYRNLGIDCKIVLDPVELNDSQKIVLPGVGAFGALSSFLHVSHFTETLKILLDGGVKLLGICLGMQILTRGSEETADCTGLSLFDFTCKKFQGEEFRVPHTGWDEVSVRNNHEIFEGLNSEFSAYFSHSYYLPTNTDLSVAVTKYGIEFTSVIAKGNVVGVQFHPERSQANGKKILSNFAEW